MVLLNSSDNSTKYNAELYVHEQLKGLDTLIEKVSKICKIIRSFELSESSEDGDINEIYKVEKLTLEDDDVDALYFTYSQDEMCAHLHNLHGYDDITNAYDVIKLFQAGFPTTGKCTYCKELGIRVDYILQENEIIELNEETFCGKTLSVSRRIFRNGNKEDKSKDGNLGVQMREDEMTSTSHYLNINACIGENNQSKWIEGNNQSKCIEENDRNNFEGDNQKIKCVGANNPNITPHYFKINECTEGNNQKCIDENNQNECIGGNSYNKCIEGNNQNNLEGENQKISV